MSNKITSRTSCFISFITLNIRSYFYFINSNNITIFCSYLMIKRPYPTIFFRSIYFYFNFSFSIRVYIILKLFLYIMLYYFILWYNIFFKTRSNIRQRWYCNIYSFSLSLFSNIFVLMFNFLLLIIFSRSNFWQFYCIEKV